MACWVVLAGCSLLLQVRRAPEYGQGDARAQASRPAGAFTSSRTNPQRATAVQRSNGLSGREHAQSQQAGLTFDRGHGQLTSIFSVTP